MNFEDPDLFLTNVSHFLGVSGIDGSGIHNSPCICRPGAFGPTCLPHGRDPLTLMPIHGQYSGYVYVSKHNLAWRSGMRRGIFATLLPDHVRPSGLRRRVFAFPLPDHGRLVLPFPDVIDVKLKVFSLYQ